MSTSFLQALLESTGASSSKEIETIQTLWSGYGKISRFQLSGSKWESVVVKHIAPNSAETHPRGWNTNVSHQRKIRSYEIEVNWYKQWSKDCQNGSKVPAFIGSFKQGNEQWIILEDLRLEYPQVKRQIPYNEVKSVLSWLANFHATFMGKEPQSLWQVGTYWHLDTRPDEFELIENKELKSKAQAIDDKLNDCRFKTIVHGDAKLANFCFAKDGRVAAVDFQYVGGGCGMKDVAYFLGSCLSGEEMELYEDDLLRFYFTELENSLGSDYDRFTELEEEWREMYPVAHTDFIRFLMGWMPSHQKINGYNLSMMNRVLQSIE